MASGVVLKTSIVGMQFRQGAQTRLNTLKHGQILRLQREANNPHDHGAVAVYDDTFKLGYIPRADNRNLAMALDSGVAIGCFIDRWPPKLHIVYPYSGVGSHRDATFVGEKEFEGENAPDFLNEDWMK